MAKKREILFERIWKIASIEPNQVEKSISEPTITSPSEGELEHDHNLQESQSEPRLSLVRVSRIAQFKVDGEIGGMKLEGKYLFIASGHMIQFWNLVHPNPILLTTITSPSGNTLSDFSASTDYILINSNGEISNVKLSTGFYYSIQYCSNSSSALPQMRLPSQTTVYLSQYNVQSRPLIFYSLMYRAQTILKGTKILNRFYIIFLKHITLDLG